MEKTSLAYHLSWMSGEQGIRVVALDLDPQGNLTAAFLDEVKIKYLWEEAKGPQKIYRCLSPFTKVGDLEEADLEPMAVNLHLVSGDVALTGFEETLSYDWPNNMGDSDLYRPFKTLTGRGLGVPNKDLFQELFGGCSSFTATILMRNLSHSLCDN